MSTHQPFIGITCDTTVLKGKEHEYELVCDHRYAEAVKNAGGFPILIPIASRSYIIKKILETIDGLIIVGGDDVDPKLYGEARKPKTGTVFSKRLQFERRLYTEAKKIKIPILGICYGMQLINVLEGGALFQDIKRDAKSKINHQNKKNPFTKAFIEKRSRLFKVIHQRHVRIHCEHHQAVSRVAPGFRPVAFGQDGIIEAIEGDGRNETYAIQWHPERTPNSLPTQRLFRSFVGHCK